MRIEVETRKCAECGALVDTDYNISRKEHEDFHSDVDALQQRVKRLENEVEEIKDVVDSMGKVVEAIAKVVGR